MSISRTPIIIIPEIENLIKNREFIYKEVRYKFETNRILQHFSDKSPESVANYSLVPDNQNKEFVNINIQKIKDNNLPKQLRFVIGFIPDNLNLNDCIIVN